MTSIRRSLLGVLMAAWAMSAGGADITMAEVVKGVSADGNTKLAAQQYWKAVDEQEVTWSGEVIEVKGGRNEANVYVADKSQPLYKGYNIVVKTYDVEKAANLKKGQTVRFTGELSRYKVKRVGAVITIGKARLL
jgi:hypothetical protein